MSAVTDVIHSTTDMVGLTDYAGQQAAQDAANRNADLAREQADRSYELTKDQLEFQKAQYDDWKNIYGPLQEDLGTYYKNLTGDKLAAQQIEAIQRESQQAQTNVDQQLAQRGLSQSGLQAEAIMRNQSTASMAKADARANADQMANTQKMNFLGLGLGQGTQMLGINANVANQGSSSAIGAMGVYGGMSNSNLSASTTLSLNNQNTTNEWAGTAAGYLSGGGSSSFSGMFGG